MSAIDIQYYRDVDGRWWWRCEWYKPENVYGPFRTKAAAKNNAQYVTLLGPLLKIMPGKSGPASDRLQ